MGEKILIVDDEQEIVDFVRDALQDEGYRVLVAYSGEEVFGQLHHRPDLIVLDVMMPGLDGFAICQSIRDRVGCPIIFLSACQTEADRIQGLLAGGDDYLVKPFSIRELKARIRAHLRREQRSLSNRQLAIFHYGDLTIKLNSFTVFYREQAVPLTSREFEVLQFLVLHPDQVFTREHIYEKVWGYDAMGDSSVVTEHIKKIRAKIAAFDPDTAYIATIWGVGYKWAWS